MTPSVSLYNAAARPALKHSKQAYGFAGTPEEVAAGRRRTMFLLSLVAFGLATGAA